MILECTMRTERIVASVVTETCHTGDSVAPANEPAGFEIVLLSVPRQVDYFTDTMRAVRLAFPRETVHVVTNVSSPQYAAYVARPQTLLHVVDVTSLLGRDLKVRSTAMYEYALSVVSPAADILVVEDDVAVSAHASVGLQRTVQEIWARGRTAPHGFVRDCYVVAWQGVLPRVAWEYAFVEDDFRCCTQCMYYSRAASPLVRTGLRQAWREHPTPYDFVIRDTTRRHGIPVYGTVSSLVQHRGVISSGLTGTSFLHTSKRYDGV